MSESGAYSEVSGTVRVKQALTFQTVMTVTHFKQTLTPLNVVFCEADYRHPVTAIIIITYQDLCLLKRLNGGEQTRWSQRGEQYNMNI